MRSLFALAALPFVFAAPAPARGATQATQKYIVVLKDEHNVASVFKRDTPFSDITPFQTYDYEGFSGFAASLTAHQVKDIQEDSKVAYVELDGILHTQHKWSKRQDVEVEVVEEEVVEEEVVEEEEGEEDAEDSDADNETITQSNSTWGLGRISHRIKGSMDYLYDPSSGEGTCAYIIDTGIYIEHADFEGRATFVKNWDKVDGTDADMFGHGTHVAGTIGSKTYGVAKKAQLFAMKVCNQYGDCQLSDVNAAILETITDSKQRNCPNGVVINMSLGAPNSEWKSIGDAVKQATNAGIFVAVAAGNENDNSSKYSPASVPEACAAGASDLNDAIASFSNWGKPVAVFAPGVDVLSLSNAGQGQTATMSGTSMASPHLAGLAAYFQGLNGKTEPAQLCSLIKKKAVKNAITGIKAGSGTSNLLAYNGMA